MPNCVEAHNNLGTVLARRGRIEEAIGQFRRVLASEPDNADARNNLGDGLATLGQFREAIVQFQRVLASEPDNVPTRFSLADALANSGRLDEAIAQYRQVLKISPSRPRRLPAWRLPWSAAAGSPRRRPIFATRWRSSPTRWSSSGIGPGCGRPARSPRVRNGEDAIEHAQLANQLCGEKRPDVLDVLAAAYAEAGRFPEALGTAHQALELARQQNNSSLADAVPRSNRPIRSRKTLSRAPPSSPEAKK